MTCKMSDAIQVMCDLHRCIQTAEFQQLTKMGTCGNVSARCEQFYFYFSLLLISISTKFSIMQSEMQCKEVWIQVQ